MWFGGLAWRDIKQSASLQASKADYGDGLVEVYGLTQGALAPGWTVSSVPQHTVRLGQGPAVRFAAQGDYKKSSKGSASDASAAIYVLVDSESWWQKVPVPPSGVSKAMTPSSAFVVRFLQSSFGSMAVQGLSLLV
jgi:hypothetical protein